VPVNRAAAAGSPGCGLLLAAVARCGVRAREERSVGGGAVHLALLRAMDRVGLAGSGVLPISRQARTPKAAVAAIRCISSFWRCGDTRATFTLVGT
jgi:hypothetical protein